MGFQLSLHVKRWVITVMINQQVTIGWKSIIGNSVQIRAGAFIKDHVVVGDDVIIGAHAVVLNDIPAHSVVVGIPAKIIKTRKSESCAWEEVTKHLV
jgi:serine O-acetyltransferase